MFDMNNHAQVPLTNQWFTTTHWTVVLAAKKSSSPGHTEALNYLCHTYWAALYGYVRRQGHSPADAADLTQAFFLHFLEKQFLQDVNAQKGKFRSFLLKALNHFLADEWKYHHAQKRSGSHATISINTDDWEARHGHELVSAITPEKLFERRWAITLFDQVLRRLRDEAVQTGKAREFDLLKEFLSSRSSAGAYATAAGKLGLSEGAVAVHVHRLRKRYGQLVRQYVAQTVADPNEVEEELRHLLNVLSE